MGAMVNRTFRPHQGASHVPAAARCASRRAVVLRTLALGGAWVGLALGGGQPGARPARADEVDPYAALVAQTDPLPATEQARMFHLPPGFEIQLIASEPEIAKPINLAFDAQGRLWVTQSLEYPYAAAEKAPHRDTVRVFSEWGADGRAGRSEAVVTGLNIPIGVLPVGDGAVVYSIPGIDRWRDGDADGLLEQRQPLFGPFGFQDTHGMCSSFRRGLDGWVLACHGFTNTSTVAGTDGQAVTMNSGNTYRFQLDGSRIEYFTHGQVNPFGLSFDPLGNLYSSDCHTLPIYLLLRGAWYPSFGKPDDGLGFGPTLLSHLHGSTGIAGVAYYADDRFPAEYRETIFVGNPVTGRINHDRLEPRGSGAAAIELPDFLSCDDPWFRPVDVRLGPDGALYVADFYNAVIGHYEVPLTHPRRDREKGRLWRIVYRGEGARPVHWPDLTTSTAEQLVATLADENLELRTLATHELVDRIGSQAVPILAAVLADRGRSPWQRVHAMWALERLAGLELAALRALTTDEQQPLRVHAVRCLGQRAEWESTATGDFEVVRARLADEDALVRRVAVEALARHPAADNVAPLLTVWAQTDAIDTHLIHAVRMALRDQLLWPGVYETAQGLATQTPQAQRLADVSCGAATPAAAEFLMAHLASPALDRGQLGRFVHHAARYLEAGRLAELQTWARTLEAAPPGEQIATLRALHQAAQERGAELPGEFIDWAQRLATQLLASDEEQVVRNGIDLARDLRLRGVHAALVRWGLERQRFAGLRPGALSACAAVDGPASVEPLAQVLSDGGEPPELRQHAARELANVGQPAAREALTAALAGAPDRVAVVVAEGLANSNEGTEALLSAVGAGKAAPGLLQEWSVNLRLNGRKVDNLRERVAELVAHLPPGDERLKQAVDARREQFAKLTPDLARGEAAFRKTCLACHRLRGEGQKIGPELDGIGVRGLERVLEDVLNPNRNVDQAFRTTLIEATDGRVLSGLALREEGDVLVLADAQGKEVRVPSAEIASRTVTPLSPMPANVLDQVGEEEFLHLVGFLLNQRAPVQGPTPEEAGSPVQ